MSDESLEATSGTVATPPVAPPGPLAPSTPQIALRPGQLPVGWQIMVATAWTVAFFAFAAVWKTSEEIGIATWWIGPRGDPRPVFVRIMPFALALLVALTAVYNLRRSAVVSAVASIAVAGIAANDISRSGGLAAIEFAIAAALLLVSVGAQAGSVRRHR